MDDHELAVIENVEALSIERALICAVAGIRVAVPRRCIEPCSEVRQPGDRGKLVMSAWLARTLGFDVAVSITPASAR